MSDVDESLYLVLALRPDMTDSDARWAAGLVTEMKSAKARVTELEAALAQFCNEDCPECGAVSRGQYETKRVGENLTTHRLTGHVVPHDADCTIGKLMPPRGRDSDSAMNKTSGAAGAVEPGLSTTGQTGAVTSHEPARGPEEAGISFHHHGGVTVVEVAPGTPPIDTVAIKLEAGLYGPGNRSETATNDDGWMRRCRDCGVTWNGLGRAPTACHPELGHDWRHLRSGQPGSEAK